MQSTWIVNASPFIVLAKVGRVELLVEEERTVYIPEAVVDEVKGGDYQDAAVVALGMLKTFGIQTLVEPYHERVAAFNLDYGEIAVLSTALDHPGSVCVIDDGPGRAAARVLGLNVVGTLGVLIQARLRGRIVAVAPIIRALQNVGMYLPSDASLRQTLTPLGENWP